MSDASNIRYYDLAYNPTALERYNYLSSALKRTKRLCKEFPNDDHYKSIKLHIKRQMSMIEGEARAEAWDNFILALGKALYLDKICGWLNRKLS